MVRAIGHDGGQPAEHGARRRLAAALVAVLLAACGLVLGACGGDEAPSGAGSETTTGAPSAGEPTRCAHPAGFSLTVPEGWEVNAGDGLPRCSLFHPEPFEVPEATDARVAAIAASVEPAPFHRVAAPREGRDAERAVTAIDGLQAVRLSYETSGEGLYPPGTPVTMYAIDLSDGADERRRTLVLDTVGLTGFDHDRNARALDRMARSVDVAMAGVEEAPGVVARYGGGGGAFRVEADGHGDRACLRIPPRGEPICVAVPGPGGVATVTFEDPRGAILAGVTGQRVAEVIAERGDRAVRALPVPVRGAPAGAFAFAFGPGDVAALVLEDATGDVIGRHQPVGGAEPDPVGPGRTSPAEAGGFPAGGAPARLVDVRVGAHRGFDRIVLGLRGDAPSHRVAYVEPPVRADGSGHRVQVDGSAFLEIRLSPASGVDLRGGEARPTYTGPRRLAPADTRAVEEVVRTGDFEAQLAWVAGLDRRRPFAVEMLERPPRLVVDVLTE